MNNNRPQLLVTAPLILHTNARPHVADVVTKILRDYGWEMLLHAPYSPEMSPLHCDLFSKLKEPMSGRHFSFLEDLSSDGTGTRALRQKNKSGVLDGIIMLPKR